MTFLGRGNIGESAKQRAEVNLKGGLILESDFTGQMCAETGIRMQIRGMKIVGAKVSEDMFKSWSTCDSGQVCQKVIGMSFLAHNGPCHLFGQINDHLPAHAEDELQRRRPPTYRDEKRSSVSAEERKRRLDESRDAYQDQANYLRQNRTKIFRPG
eukprot:9487267-Pyramimonas_sp.AAC.1